MLYRRNPLPSGTRSPLDLLSRKIGLCAYFSQCTRSVDVATLVDQARVSRRTPTPGYFMGAPLFGDHIEAGLEILGYDVAALESSI